MISEGSEHALGVLGKPAPRPVDEVLSVAKVSKRYGGIQALDRVDVTVSRGKVHAILGENGAGKSTLVKIIAGVVPLDEGQIRVDGRVFEPVSPQETRQAGISVVYQELSLVPQLSVAHNLFLDRLPRTAGLVSLRKSNRIAERVLAELGIVDIDPKSPVSELALDKRQMIEIVRATLVTPKILVLDEATSSLGRAEVDRLFALVHKLIDLGSTVLVITHRMSEVWELAESMTILRDGKTVGYFEVAEMSRQDAVRLMAGRDVSTSFPAKSRRKEGATALELRDVQLRRGCSPWQLDLRRGEILGLGGLEGQGQRELLAWLYGSGLGSGNALRDGRPLKIRRPADALRQGIAYIPEDRKVEGLHLDLPVRWNLAMATLGQRSRFGFIRTRAEKELANKLIDEGAIKVDSPFQLASSLSGGTQQKVVLGKFLARRPSILLFVDPTRGIDVQTKFAFYEMMRDVARAGASCVMYSSDTEELVGLCDRVAVFHDGMPLRILEGDEITQEAIVAASFAVIGDAI
jgi:ribose transport system ATP-binding protein